MSVSDEECHSASLLRQMCYFWQEQHFCDVTVLVEDASFRVHRIVLSAASGYFQGMFLGNMKETYQDEVTILGVSKGIFSQLLHFIYTGDVDITEENCQELLSGADMLSLSGLLQQCCDFLHQQLDAANCLGISQFADCHGCVGLKQEALSFVHKHFLQVVEEEEYFSLAEEQLLPILQSEYLQIDNEYQVFKAAMNWILHNIKTRRKCIFSICASIRFPIISYKQLEAYIETCSDLSLQIALKKVVGDFKQCSASGLSQRHQLRLKLKPYMFQPRKFARKCIYVSGGYSRQPGQRWSDSISLSAVHCFSSFDQSWRSEPSLHQSRSGHGACVLNGRIYMIGGESDSLIFDSAEMFDPLTSKWELVSSLTVPRCGLGVCALGGAIYAIGGWIGSQIGATVEKFEPSDNVWREWDRMPTLRFAMGVTQNEGLIYLAGGTSEMGTELDLLESYNPVTKEWLPLPRMNTKRAYVGFAAIDSMLYAVGGWNEDSGALSTVERYDIQKMKWNFLPNMSSKRAGAGVASINGYLYVMGGRTTTSDSFTAPATLASVECYDPQTEMWLDLGQMPGSHCEAAVAVL